MVEHGDRVYARWSDGLWFSATVVSVAYKKVQVVFEKDGISATVALRDVDRVRAPDPIDRNPDYEVGAFVIAPWSDGAWYSGRVLKRSGCLFAVRYDKGDFAWVDDVQPDYAAKARAAGPIQLLPDQLETMQRICAELDRVDQLGPALDRVAELLDELRGIEHRSALPSLLGLLERCGEEEEDYGVFETLIHRIEATTVEDTSAQQEVCALFERQPCRTTATLLLRAAKEDPGYANVLEAVLSRPDISASLKEQITYYLEILRS